MQTSAAIPSCVDDTSVAQVILPEHVAVYCAEAGIVHRLQMDISEASARYAVHDMLASPHPSVVEQ